MTYRPSAALRLLGALEYPTTNSCGPINKSSSLSSILILISFKKTANVVVGYFYCTEHYHIPAVKVIDAHYISCEGAYSSLHGDTVISGYKHVSHRVGDILYNNSVHILR